MEFEENPPTQTPTPSAPLDKTPPQNSKIVYIFICILF